MGTKFRGLPPPLRQILEDRLSNFSMVPLLSSETVLRVLLILVVKTILKWLEEQVALLDSLSASRSLLSSTL